MNSASDGNWAGTKRETVFNGYLHRHSRCFRHFWRPDDVRGRISRLQYNVSRDEVVDDAEEDCGEGACALCDRQMPLTFHHLVPKEVTC